MLIEPPVNAITDTGVQNWDSGLSIKAKIESGAYNLNIENALDLAGIGPKFGVALIKDTKLIKISLMETPDKTDLGKKILVKLLEELNDDYAKIVTDKRNRIDNQILMVLSQISTKENEIKLKNEQFKILEDREPQFLNEIKETKANSERLLAKREAVFERKETRDDVSALFYAATIQQNMSYFTQLQNDLSDLKNKKESTLNAVNNLKNDIGASRIEIRNLNLLKDNVQNIGVVQEPHVSPWPIGPKKKQNILIAAIAGLVLGLFAAFFVEYFGESFVA